jgi:hypothetical protein
VKSPENERGGLLDRLSSFSTRLSSSDYKSPSPEYQPLIALRKSCTSDQDMMFTMQGV